MLDSFFILTAVFLSSALLCSRCAWIPSACFRARVCYPSSRAFTLFLASSTAFCSLVNCCSTVTQTSITEDWGQKKVLLIKLAQFILIRIFCINNVIIIWLPWWNHFCTAIFQLLTLHLRHSAGSSCVSAEVLSKNNFKEDNDTCTGSTDKSRLKTQQKKRIVCFLYHYKDLNVYLSLLQRRCLVSFVLLTFAVSADTGLIQKTEALERKLMNLTSLTVNVMEGIHQTMVLRFCILQVRSEVGVAVGDQTGQTRLQRSAGGVHAGITQHIF